MHKQRFRYLSTLVFFYLSKAGNFWAKHCLSWV